MVVIDRLEVIEVGHDCAQRLMSQSGVFQLMFEFPDRMAAAEYAGQRIFTQ